MDGDPDGMGSAALVRGERSKRAPIGTPVREGSVSGARKGKTLKKSYGRGRGSNNFNTSNDNIKISLQIAATPPSTLSNANATFEFEHRKRMVN